MTLRECALKAIEIYSNADQAASMDEEFGSDLCTPLHASMADAQVESLALANGFTFAQVDAELNRICHEHEHDPIDEIAELLP